MSDEPKRKAPTPPAPKKTPGLYGGWGVPKDYGLPRTPPKDKPDTSPLGNTRKKPNTSFGLIGGDDALIDTVFVAGLVTMFIILAAAGSLFLVWLLLARPLIFLSLAAFVALWAVIAYGMWRKQQDKPLIPPLFSRDDAKRRYDVSDVVGVGDDGELFYTDDEAEVMR